MPCAGSRQARISACSPTIVLEGRAPCLLAPLRKQLARAKPKRTIKKKTPFSPKTGKGSSSSNGKRKKSDDDDYSPSDGEAEEDQAPAAAAAASKPKAKRAKKETAPKTSSALVEFQSAKTPPSSISLSTAHTLHLRRAARRVDVGGGRRSAAPQLDLRTPPPRQLLLARPLGHRGQVAAAQGARTAQGRLSARKSDAKWAGGATGTPPDEVWRRSRARSSARASSPLRAPQVALRRRAALRARVGVRAARGCRHAHAAGSYLVGLPAHPDNHRAANDLTDGQDEGGGRQKGRGGRCQAGGGSSCGSGSRGRAALLQGAGRQPLSRKSKAAASGRRLKLCRGEASCTRGRPPRHRPRLHSTFSSTWSHTPPSASCSSGSPPPNALPRPVDALPEYPQTFRCHGGAGAQPFSPRAASRWSST